MGALLNATVLFLNSKLPPLTSSPPAIDVLPVLWLWLMVLLLIIAFVEEKINYINYKVISGKLTLKAEIELEKYTDSRIPIELTDKLIENCLMKTQDKKNKHWYAQCYLSNDVIENFLLMPKEQIEKKIFTFYVISILKRIFFYEFCPLLVFLFCTCLHIFNSRSYKKF